MSSIKHYLNLSIQRHFKAFQSISGGLNFDFPSPPESPPERCFLLLFHAPICTNKKPVSADLQVFTLFCFHNQRREWDSNP